MEEVIQIMKQEGVFKLKNASVELSFDDVGLLQQMVFKKKRRRRTGEDLMIYMQKSGKAIADYDKDGVIQHITYETKWHRPLA